ncbi:hypothetical protein [Pseudomonas solani]|uniref:hypothetical protein n=1 Tax=Pseudomonas solani TaxID=2731552 RepID=UPI003D6C1428
MAVQNPFKSGSIAGNLPLATQKAKGISPLPGIMPIAPPTTARPSPLRIDGGIDGYQPPAPAPTQRNDIAGNPVPGNPARSKAMRAQYDQPVIKGIPQNGIGGGVDLGPAQEQPQGKGFLRGLADFGNGVVNTALGGAEALIAGPLDWGRNGITTLSGGDPQSLPGGPTAFRDTANRRLSTGLGQLGGTASAVGDTALAGLGANRRDGSDPSAPNPAGIGGTTTAVQRQAQTPSGGEAALPGLEPVKVAPNGIGGFGETGIAGVVGRRGANGVMEFSNDPGAVAGATGKVGGGIGDGIGTLSIMSGGREGMERNLAAAEIIRQTRRDNAGGGLSIVGDSTRGRGLDQQQAERIASADWDRQQQAKLSARQERGIGGGLQDFQNNQLQRQVTEQQIAARGLEIQKQQKLNGLLAGLDNPNLAPEVRAQLQDTYLTLTTPLKDQRVVGEVELTDNMGVKTKKPVVTSVISGQQVGGGGADQPATPVSAEAQAAYDKRTKEELQRNPGSLAEINRIRRSVNLEPLTAGGTA